MISLIIVVLLILIVSGLASSTEAALFSVPYSKVLTLVDKNKSGAKALLNIQENMQRPIATIVIVNNIANIVGSIMVGAMAAEVLGSSLLGIFSAVLTFLVIVFSEIAPKTLGERHADKWALMTSRPVLWLTKLLTPVVYTIEFILRPINKGKHSPITSEAEIKVMAHLGQKEGIIEEDEGLMIKRVFRLNDITANYLMTPRMSVNSLDGDQTVLEVKKIALTSNHSRLPVFEKTLDHVVGVVHQRELLKKLSEGKELRELVKDIAEPALFVSHTMPADDLLEKFQKERSHLAIVVDATGSTVGVVSLEDVLEELVGEIIDETDKEPHLIRKISSKELACDGQADVHHINDMLGTSLPGQGSLSQLVFEQAEKIPEKDEVIEIGNVQITITKASAHQILKARIKKLKL